MAVDRLQYIGGTIKRLHLNVMKNLQKYLKIFRGYANNCGSQRSEN